MLHRKFLVYAFSALSALLGFAGSFGHPAPLPQSQAAVVAPKLRFGQGRLYVPREIRISGSEILVYPLPPVR